MAFIILACLIIVPILEILLFIKAGAVIGWLSVVLLTITTAVLGTVIIRWQGLQAVRELQTNLSDGRAPVAPMMDGVFLLMAAPFLMTPGFLTDGVGFLLLVPPVRYAIARWALSKLRSAVENGKVTIITPGKDDRDGPQRPF